MATGSYVTTMLPIPSLDNRVFDQARKFEERGYRNVLFKLNNVGDYKDIKYIWKGTNPASGIQLFVKEGSPKQPLLKD
ncbi:hypothetical protein WAX74_01435 [Psychrobacillus sp. FJAT-51614]|uniref:Uncharacterized protein n=1 Tax=Psychrobacillus mangrovi TaxID=3117745 RepID=A0ABU8EZY2_9BACI